MTLNRTKAAAAAFALLLLLAACGGPAKGETSSAPSETGAPPPESLEFEQEHDHTGIPGLDLPESLPVGDYAFEAYDSSQVQVTSMILTVDGETVDAIVLTVPRDTKNFVECYADGVLARLFRLEEKGENGLTSALRGSLTGDDQWAEGDTPMKAGDRYDLTFGEPGLFRLDLTDAAGTTETYYFLVSE